jgi:hypothetical protein
MVVLNKELNMLAKFRLFRSLSILAAFIFCAASVFSYEIAEDEIRLTDPPIIQFENFTGVPDKNETAEQIKGIGRFLGSAQELGQQTLDYAGRYRIIRVADQENPYMLQADILILLPDARVNHIDNLRRIIAGYLEQTYQYSVEDAALLAQFVTIYNAVHRQDLEFFTGRYSPAVLQVLRADIAGLPLSYREWPGGSQIVIPIRDPNAQQQLGTISPGELTDDEVMDDLRTRQDMGLEDRRDMVDLFERVIEEEEQNIVEEQQAIDQERQELEQQREEAADDPERQQEIAQAEEELDQREAQLEQREEDVQDMREQADEMRQEAAQDQNTVLREQDVVEASPAEGNENYITLLAVVQTSPVMRSQLIKIDPLNGKIAARAPGSSIVGRQLVSVADGLAGPVDDNGDVKLAVFSPDTLEIVRMSTVVLHEATAVESAAGSGVYAVVVEDGDAFLGRFYIGP